MIGSRIFSEKIRIFPKYFFQLKWKNWNQLYKTNTQTFHKTITYNNVILVRSVLQFWDLIFFYISIALSLYILSLAKARNKINSKKAWTFSIKRKFLSQKLYITANQNNGVYLLSQNYFRSEAGKDWIKLKEAALKSHSWF